MLRLALVLSIILGIATSETVGRAAVTAPPAPSRHTAQAMAGVVPISGRGFYVTCAGAGSPPIILEGGYGGGVRDWSEVLPALAQTSRVCAYDRAGVGLSDPSPDAPHTAVDASRDLQALLEAIDVHEQVVIVGFSIGGLLARYHAAKHPDLVAGLVLIDPTPPTWPAIDLSNTPFPARRAKLEALSGFDNREPELLDVLKTGSQVLAATPARSPVIMVTSGIKSANPGMPGDDLERVLTGLQDDQARVQRADHRVAERCTHQIPMQCPETVITAVQQMLDRLSDESLAEAVAVGFESPDAIVSRPSRMLLRKARRRRH